MTPALSISFLLSTILVSIRSASALNHCIVRAYASPNDDLVSDDVEAVAAITLMHEFLQPNQYLLIEGVEVDNKQKKKPTEAEAAEFLATCLAHYQYNAVVVLNFHGDFAGASWHVTTLYLLYSKLMAVNAAVKKEESKVATVDLDKPTFSIVYSSCNSPWSIEENKLAQSVVTKDFEFKAFKKLISKTYHHPAGQLLMSDDKSVKRADLNRGSHICLVKDKEGGLHLGLKYYKTEAPSPQAAMVALAKLASPKSKTPPKAGDETEKALFAYSDYLLSELDQGSKQEFVPWEKAFPAVYTNGLAGIKAIKGGLINKAGSGASSYIQLQSSLRHLRDAHDRHRRARRVGRDNAGAIAGQLQQSA